MVGTEYTSFLSWVKVFRHIASYTLFTSPVQSRWAVTTSIDKNLTSRTVQTLPKRSIPKSIVRTDRTSVPIEKGSAGRAINTFLITNVVYSIATAELTGESVVIKIFREEARNTLISVIVIQRVDAFTFFRQVVDLTTVIAILAFISCWIEILVDSTCHTSFIVEERFRWWTFHTFFCFWIILLRKRTW